MTKKYKGLRGQGLYHGSTGKRSIDTYWTNFIYSKLYPNKKNRYIGGSLSHGEHLGNNHILSRSPDWDDLLGYADDNQQLAAAVHDYQLATAKTHEGVRIAHENYAKNAHGMITMGLFDGLAGQKRPYGFEVYNLEPGYNPPPEVYKRLRIEQPTRGNKHFNVAVDAPKRSIERVSRDTSQRKSLRADFNMETLPQESVDQIMDFQGDRAPEVIAENFGDNDSPINLHMDHNLQKSMSKNFGETKKLVTTNVQVGSGSSLSSVPSILGAFYKGARTLSTSWHHAGTSEMDRRSVFTYVFRHTVKNPSVSTEHEPVILSPSIEYEDPSTLFKEQGTDLLTATTFPITFSALVNTFTDTSGNSGKVKPINVSTWDELMYPSPLRDELKLGATSDGTDENGNPTYPVQTLDQQRADPRNPNLTPTEKARILTKLNTLTKLKSTSSQFRYDPVPGASGIPAVVNVLPNQDLASGQSIDLIESKDWRLPFYHQRVKSDVHIITPERDVRVNAKDDNIFDTNIAGSKVAFVPSTWYSPFCLQELETLSWNLNRMKLLPAPRGMYSNANISDLPGRVSKDAIMSADDFVDDSTNLVDPNDVVRLTGTSVTSSFGTFKNHLYDVKEIKHSPLHSMGLKYGKLSALSNKSVVSYPLAPTGSQNLGDDVGVQHKAELADFKAQLGKSDVTFTFVNTGDTTMIVEAVCHRAKEDCVIGPHHILPSQGFTDLSHSDVTSLVARPYMHNYIAHHRANQIRKVSNDVPLVDDCLRDPGTKFLPTSYRLPKGGPAPNPDGRTTHSTHDVSFIDIDRRSFYIGPNSRKTVRFVMPTNSYTPVDHGYHGLLNDQGLAITFSVCGKAVKAIADTEHDDLAAQAVGKISAPTSFHIIGRETQQVYPCCISEFSKPMKQIYTLPDPMLATGQDAKKRLHSAMYIGPNLRDVKGRYAQLLIDNGSMTKEESIQSRRLSTDGQHGQHLEDIASNTEAGTNVVLTGINMDADDTVNENVLPVSGTGPIQAIGIASGSIANGYINTINTALNNIVATIGYIPSQILVSAVMAGIGASSVASINTEWQLSGNAAFSSPAGTQKMVYGVHYGP